MPVMGVVLHLSYVCHPCSNLGGRGALGIGAPVSKDTRPPSEETAELVEHFLIRVQLPHGVLTENHVSEFRPQSEGHRAGSETLPEAHNLGEELGVEPHN